MTEESTKLQFLEDQITEETMTMLIQRWFDGLGVDAKSILEGSA